MKFTLLVLVSFLAAAVMAATPLLATTFVTEDGDSRTDGDNPMPAGGGSATSGESPFGKTVTSPSRGLVQNPETPEPGETAKTAAAHGTTEAAATAATAHTPEAGTGAAAAATTAATVTAAAAAGTTTSGATATAAAAPAAAAASETSAAGGGDASFQCALCVGFTEKFKATTAENIDCEQFNPTLRLVAACRDFWRTYGTIVKERRASSAECICGSTGHCAVASGCASAAPAAEAHAAAAPAAEAHAAAAPAAEATAAHTL